MVSLLNSGSMVSLGQQSYFDRNIQPKQGPARRLEVTFHNLFNLKDANGGDIPITQHFEMNVAFLALKVQCVRFLTVKESRELLETKKKTKLSGITRWNLLKLAHQECIKKYPKAVFSNSNVQKRWIHCCSHSYVFTIIPILDQLWSVRSKRWAQ